MCLTDFGHAVCERVEETQGGGESPSGDVISTLVWFIYSQSVSTTATAILGAALTDIVHIIAACLHRALPLYALLLNNGLAALLCCIVFRTV